MTRPAPLSRICSSCLLFWGVLLMTGCLRPPDESAMQGLIPPNARVTWTVPSNAVEPSLPFPVTEIPDRLRRPNATWHLPDVIEVSLANNPETRQPGMKPGPQLRIF